MATLGRCMRAVLLKSAGLLSKSQLMPPGPRCWYHRHLPGVFKSLYNRRLEQGPEPERARSAWANWNYNSEIFAFGNRLGEDFKDETLKRAFTHKSYVSQDAAKRKELGMDEDALATDLLDNTELATRGEAVARDFIKAYLRCSLHQLPEEGICSITEYLMKDETLAHVGRHLGVTDLVLCEEFPVSASSISTCFKAVIGGLCQDHSVERAQLFTLDFVVTQLVGKTLDEIWRVPDPMGLLAGIMRKTGSAEPEPRLIWQAGSETMVAAYMVGIYSDRQLIGKAPGETVSIAEEMAARDALRTLFGLTIERTPFKFGSAGHQLALNSTASNARLEDLTASQLIS